MLCNFKCCRAESALLLEDWLTTEMYRDMRQQKMRWQNPENNDDITALDFNATKPQILLSGGDDGLVSLFDTTIQEEDDSLIQAFNHAPIHKAGFVDQRAIYALGSDQDLSIHPVFDEDRDTEPAPVQLGDVRPLVSCEYVIDLLHVGKEFVLATGSHRCVQTCLKKDIAANIGRKQITSRSPEYERGCGAGLRESYASARRAW